MSSAPQKAAPKMCKSPKNSNFQAAKPDKVQIINEYENLNTNCTVIGSNNLHLVKKPQVITSMSPVYSHPSPGYPPSPYSSPASLKSPSPQSFKPPTPQPTFPVMQIIHSSHQLVARPIQTTQTQQNVIKLKPHLNILPKPSASPQPPPKPSVSPHIVIPSQQATIVPTAQPLLLNQMPMLAPGVQLILRPQTTKIPTHMQAAAHQGLILQPGGQQLLQIQPSRAQPMVRVLTNGVLAPQTQVVTQVASPAVMTHTLQQAPIPQHEFPQDIPKKKVKKKKQKLDLANIMKLSGIGDEDDIQFESDTSQSESEPTTVHSEISHPQHVMQETNVIRSQANVMQTTDSSKRIGNIQISAMAQPTVSTATPLVQLLNQSFQSGVNNTSFQTSQAQGIPLNSFITPNITINNGLVVQRNGGFKLALGEDGRLVLQHDPTLNQDLQSQLLLQSIFGLNGLVLQPSVDQQVHSQTVQTIQQQSVQTIQQQTVQSQTIQTVQQQTVQPHLQTIQQAIQPQIQAVQPQTVQQTVQQTIQHQTVQSQPLSALQQQAHSQPMQIVQPQPIHTIQSHNIQQHTIQSQPVQSLPTSTVQAIQSQVHQSIQSQIQGQIQSLLQSQPLQTLQSVQTQPVHSQAQSSHITPTIQTQHQTVQSQPILKVQPFQKTPPVQTVHPQPVQPSVQAIHHPPQQNINDNQPNHPPQTSYVVNLTPDQLEQLKRNGQLTVNGQTIFMQRPNANKTPDLNHHQNNDNKVKLSPKIKPVKKVNNKIQTPSPVVKNIVLDNLNIKNANQEKHVNHVAKETKSSLVTALQAPLKIPPQNHAQVQPQQKTMPLLQPSAVVQPSVAVQPTVQTTASSQTQTPKPVQAKMQGTQTSLPDGGGPLEVDPPPGQVIEESSTSTAASAPTAQPPQRVHTIQLTPQQQQHLKSIQLQIQTLSARLTPGDTEMHTALKLLFAEQQKILASGKLLPPDKVIYQNNQLTIINPSSLGIGAVPVKAEPQILPAPVVIPRSTAPETSSNHQVVTTIATQTVPKITVTVPAISEHAPQSSVIHPVTCTAGPTIKVLTSTAQHTVSPHMQQNKYIPSFTKAQLLEQQLNTDQNGAMKPDVHTPFRDKADACKRLIRYHCYNQPVLSTKDLNKADEIFELTARHFIDKFSRMVDKYRFLLLKESMRQVQTSELMMLDRMFLAEEQQSLIRLRQELEEGTSSELLNQFMPHPPSSASEQPQEEYDEWACIQRELGCLPGEEQKHASAALLQNAAKPSGHPQASPIVQSYQPLKRSASSDSRLETLKKFRVDKHNKKLGEGVSVSNSYGGSSQNFSCTKTIMRVNDVQRNVQAFQGSQVHATATTTTYSNTLNAKQVLHSVPQQQMLQRSAHYSQSSAQNIYSTNAHQPFLHGVQFSQSQEVAQAFSGLQAQPGVSLHSFNSSSVHSVNSPSGVNSKCVQSHGSQSSESESGNNSIDEHVQSAIDSILNLQQNSSLDLDEAVSSILS